MKILGKFKIEGRADSKKGRVYTERCTRSVSLLLDKGGFIQIKENDNFELYTLVICILEQLLKRICL